MTTFPASSAEEALTGRVRVNLELVRQRIAAVGRDPDDVRIVAVTKSFGPPAVRAAAAAGLEDVGENYVAELEDKRRQTGSLGLRWHYLGALQSNKIARVSRVADVIESVSRPKEITRLAHDAPGATIYVEVDVTGRAERGGADPDGAAALVALGREQGLDVRGLMTVAPPDETGAREAFETVRALADRLDLVERSMGMSDDFELACQWGATEVRLGRVLFGDRVPAAKPSPNIGGLDSGEESA